MKISGTCTGSCQENATRFDPLSGITDFPDTTGVAFSAQTMRELARMKPIMPEASRPLVFVAPMPELFGMARRFELQGPDSRPNLRVVRTVEEAYRILRQRPSIHASLRLLPLPASQQ